MPRMYPATVRRQIVQRLRSGETVAAVAAETGIAQATLFRWKRQGLIDAGVIEGTPSVEAPKAWIESRIPERTRNVPRMARVPLPRTSDTFHTFSIPRFS